MKSVNKKNNINKIAKFSSLAFALFLGALFITIVVFILIYAIDGFNSFGIVNILFQGSFNQLNEKYSFWVPFSATIFTSLIALLFAVPIGIKVAIFTKYRMKKKFRKYILITFQALSGIPSVIFGFFASESLGLIWQNLFGINPYSIFNGSIMLAFMVIPTIISLTLDSLSNVDENYLTNAQALGNTKTSAIYKVCKKGARAGIVVAIIIAFSRAIGESMAVSMILQSQPSDAFVSNGFLNVLNSSSQTLGAYISTAMFADSDPEKIRPLLYTFGLILLLFSMILNFFILIFSRKRVKKSNSKFNEIELKIYKIVAWIPTKIKNGFENLFIKNKYKLDNKNYVDYIKYRQLNNKFNWIYPSWKIFWEWFCLLICLSFVFWIIGDATVNGILGISNNPNNFFVYSKNSISQSFVNTLLIIIVCLAIGFPIALMCAIYINEYAKDGKIKKTIIFFLDSLGSTPSIIFGIFGLLFFIQTFGWTSSGTLGNSLIAGALTLILVILPSFIRLLEQSLKNVPNEIRLNSYALGNTKWETIRKLVIPSAMVSITSSIISTIGRIFSETAPLYLTAGLSSSKNSVLNEPGTTLTTHIYAQVFSPKSNRLEIQYQAAFLTLIIVFSLVIIGYIIIPNWKNIKSRIFIYWNLIKNSFSQNDKIKGENND